MRARRLPTAALGLAALLIGACWWATGPLVAHGREQPVAGSRLGRVGLAAGVRQTLAEPLFGLLERVIANHGRPSSPAERQRSPLPADAHRVVHFVSPQDTDPAIDQFLQDHYALYNRAVPQNGKLFVFFPGTFARPSDYQWVLDEAASRGYRVIGLEYPSTTANPRQSSVVQLCTRDADPACYGRVREARLRGGDLGGLDSVTPANSIVNRLVRLLGYLQQQYPDEGWDAFMPGDQIDWSRVAVGGHSQGGGVAALIAKQYPVARVAMWSGPADYVPLAGTFATWMLEPSATPIDRYYGLVHESERGARGILGGYAALGLDRYGAPVGVAASTPPSPDAHVLVVSLPPRPRPVPMPDPNHGSTAADGLTPLGDDGRPAYRTAWDVLLGP